MDGCCGKAQVHPPQQTTFRTRQALPGIYMQQSLTLADWSSTDWQNILDNTTRFVKNVLSKQGFEDALISTWGRSLRDGKSPTELQHASSVQIHATVKIKFLESLLKASGFNLIFIVPKTPEGRIAHDWKLIWVDGNFAHRRLVHQAHQISGTKGMVDWRQRASP